MPSSSFSAVTHVGRVRTNNEDSYIARPELGLWLVADGMGGQQSGEVASAIAVHTVSEAITNKRSLTDAINMAHQAICDARDTGSAGMGTTVVALLCQGQEYEIAWVGDSRAYLWDLHQLKRLTRDHSMVQEMIDAGVISEEDASEHPQRNIITQSVGLPLKPGPRVATVRGQWSPGQSILLCSDGLSGELSDDAISTILAGAATAEDSTRQLLLAALERGGQDNITALLVNAPGVLTSGKWRVFERLLQRVKGQAFS